MEAGVIWRETSFDLVLPNRLKPEAVEEIEGWYFGFDFNQFQTHVILDKEGFSENDCVDVHLRQKGGLLGCKSQRQYCNLIV